MATKAKTEAKAPVLKGQEGEYHRRILILYFDAYGDKAEDKILQYMKRVIDAPPGSPPLLIVPLDEPTIRRCRCRRQPQGCGSKGHDPENPRHSR